MSWRNAPGGATEAAIIGVVKFGAWEVENPSMDVHADEAGVTAAHPAVTAAHPAVTADSSTTTTYQPSNPAGQGQLFPEALGYPTYGDTDKIPAVGRERTPRAAGPGRWLRVAVVLVAVAVLAAGAALGLVKAGVIGKNTGNGSGTSGDAQHQPPGGPFLVVPAPHGGRHGRRHGQLHRRHRRLRGHGHHHDRTLLGEHRHRRQEADLRGHFAARLQPSARSCSGRPRWTWEPAGRRWSSRRASDRSP